MFVGYPTQSLQSLVPSPKVSLFDEIKGQELTWCEFIKATQTLQGSWHFRGTLDGWRFDPSLERAARSWNITLNELPRIEKRLLRDFKRGFPAGPSIPPPRDQDDLAWFALMQHYGAPTRLLDWTYSPLVAGFFALDALLKCAESERRAAVWALSPEPFTNANLKKILSGEASDYLDKSASEHDLPYPSPKCGYFRELFVSDGLPNTFAHFVNPWHMSERLRIQQGIFLCPGNIRCSLEENLCCVPGVLDDPRNLRKFLLPRSEIPKASASLHQMRIDYSTLFPGMDGYARGLHHLIGFLQTVAMFADQ